MANKKFLNPINLVNLSSDPSTASEGDIYYNTTDDVVKVYANGTWVAIGAGGGSEITVSTTAPSSPETGDAWYKNDAGEFYVYDGTYWVEVNGVVQSNGFNTISVAGQSNVVADSTGDTLTLVAGTNVSITTNATNDSITINSTGAYTSVDSITYPDYITFDTTPETSSSDQGTLSWNVNDGTLDLKLSSDVTLQLGQEQHVRVHNATGSTIPNGTVVYVNGASDEHGHISVAPYVADGSVNVFNVMGLTTAAIPDDADGYVTLSGLVRGLNTSSYTAGQSVFASDTVPGGLTTTQPISPSETVSLGVVTVSDATQGIIFVQIDTGATADLVTYDHDTSLLEATNVAAALNELAYKKADINALSSSLVVYPTSVASNISGYYRMVQTIDDTDYNDTAVNISTGDLNGTGSAHLISSLVADANIFAGTPGSINITTIGNIRKTSGNANAYSEFFFRVYKRTSGGTETLLGSSSTTGAVNPTNLNSYAQFSASGNFLISNFTATDRLVIKYYSNILDDGTQSYEFQFGGTEPVRTLLPVPISVTPASNASGTIVDTSSFSGVLSGADSTVQAALNTIDDIVEIPDQTGHNGEFLKTTGSALEWATAASDIDSLTDVAIDSEVSDNELLAFDVTTGVWKNQTPAEAGIATETYVGTAISNLVDTAPSTLDTLNELAAALGDDPNFATTISTALGTKAPIASPTFTGTVTMTYPSILSDTNNNSRFGSSSLASNTTGIGNTAIGSSALSGNNGNNNTGVGHNALQLNSVGISNTAVGKDALLNTSVSASTAIGAFALKANSTGVKNTAVGWSALTSNTTGYDNTAVGYDSLSRNTSGRGNTAIGVSAMISNTTGVNNTAIGESALKSNQGGGSNVAVGNSALNNNRTGINNVAIGNTALFNNSVDGNTAVGYRALSENTTGTGNTALGNNALTISTSASNNTALGSNALATNTTGGFNTAIGANALLSNTTGSSNTAIGTSSLRSNINGGSNLAVGGSALLSNTTGGSNTAIGVQSLVNNTIGSENIAVGRFALSGNTTGNKNTAIGYSSGSSISTGSNNVIIGSNNGATIATLSNNILIADGDGNIRAQYLFLDAGWTLNGAVTLSGDLAVNGGDITSSASTVNLFNGFQTINIGNTPDNVSGTQAINIGSDRIYPQINIGNSPIAIGGNINIGGGYITSNVAVTISGRVSFPRGFTSTYTEIEDLSLTNPLSYSYGGTGLTTLGTAGQVLAVNSGGDAIEWANASSADSDQSIIAAQVFG
jgi:hypothetical protein